MQAAYSEITHTIVYAQDVKNLGETFYCPNLHCSARFRIRAINSNKEIVHFYKMKGSEHSSGCHFALYSMSYHDNGRMDKHSLYEIYNQPYDAHGNKSNPSQSPRQISNVSKSPKNIHTTRQLLEYCVSNGLDTLYRDNMLVGDIILDCRNLTGTVLYSGVSGLRLLVGSTCRYEYDKEADGYMIYFDIKSSANRNNSSLTLYARVHVSTKQGHEIIKYIVNTYNRKFKGHEIAVLGEWKTPEPCHAECFVKSPSHVVYIFRNE